MSMPWDYYVKRRGVNVVNYLKSRNCKTYEEFCAVLAKENIEPPTKRDMEVYFAKAKKRPKPAPKKQVLGTKSAVKSASRHTKVRQEKVEEAPAVKAKSGKESEQS